MTRETRKVFREDIWDVGDANNDVDDRELSEVLPREEFAAKYKGLTAKLVRQTIVMMKHDGNPILKMKGL